MLCHLLCRLPPNWPPLLRRRTRCWSWGATTGWRARCQSWPPRCRLLSKASLVSICSRLGLVVSAKLRHWCRDYGCYRAVPPPNFFTSPQIVSQSPAKVFCAYPTRFTVPQAVSCGFERSWGEGWGRCGCVIPYGGRGNAVSRINSELAFPTAPNSPTPPPCGYTPLRSSKANSAKVGSLPCPLSRLRLWWTFALSFGVALIFLLLFRWFTALFLFT